MRDHAVRVAARGRGVAVAFRGGGDEVVLAAGPQYCFNVGMVGSFVSR
ncbi:hypothetical protein ACQP2F_25910 [Actinoplanes sp. CA-030573]